MTRRDWIERLRLFRELSGNFHAALQERENPENLAVTESFHSLLVELVVNLSLFSDDDQDFTVKVNLAEKLRQCKEISMKYDTFLEGRENSDDDLSVVGSSFNSLLSELPVMAAVAVRKKVISTGDFSPCFYLQSLNFFYLSDQIKSNCLHWLY